MDNHTCRDILHSLNQLRLKGELCDVKLLVDDVPLSAHRVVLAATSPFFSQLIGSQQRTCSCQMFKLDGINKAQMLTVLDFLYTGQISLTAGKIKTMMNIAAELKIPLLLKHCRSWTSKTAQMKEGSRKSGSVAPSTCTRASALLQTYRSPAKSAHSYCLQKDLLDITAPKSTVNMQGSTVSAVDDLSVCCEVQTQSEELNNGQGMYGMYGGCTDTCCGEIIPDECIKQEIKEEPKDETQNWDKIKQEPRDRTQNCDTIKEEPSDLTQNFDSPSYLNRVHPESLELTLTMDKIESADVPKVDIQLQHALMQISQHESLTNLGVWTHKNNSGTDEMKQTNSKMKNECAKNDGGRLVKKEDNPEEVDNSAWTNNPKLQDDAKIQEKQQHSGQQHRDTPTISVPKHPKPSRHEAVCCEGSPMPVNKKSPESHKPGKSMKSGIISGMAESSVDSTRDATTGSTATATPEHLNLQTSADDGRLRVHSFKCCQCDRWCDCITEKKPADDVQSKCSDSASVYVCDRSDSRTSKSKLRLKRHHEKESEGKCKRSKSHNAAPQAQEAPEQKRESSTKPMEVDVHVVSGVEEEEADITGTGTSVGGEVCST